MNKFLLLLGLLPALTFALDAPVVGITATTDGDSVYVTLAWDPVPGAARYQVFRQDQFLGTSTLVADNAASPFLTSVPTGWNWQAQPDVLKFFEVIASDEPVLRYVLDLSGENTSVTVPHAENLNIDSPFTIEAWVFARDYQYPGHQTYVFPVNNIIGKNDDIGWGGRGYNLDLESGHPRIEIATSNTSDFYISSPEVITLNQWHHIAGCWN
jgi:hypothetical protein